MRGVLVQRLTIRVEQDEHRKLVFLPTLGASSGR